MLVGTWADAEWAIRFYRRHGFEQTSPVVPDRQIETSVVLANPPLAG
jgi:hypothetical protein